MKSRKELDFELVKAAQAGDVNAFEELIKRYETKLSRYISTLMRDVGEAEDVTQEALFKAYQGLHTFRGESSFVTWFFRIGINIAKRNLVRNRRRTSRLVEREDDPTGNQQHSPADTDFDTPESAMESRQFLDLLNSALDHLPPEQRDALFLRELEGLSYEEIAERMNCPVGTVRSRIHRARENLAVVLKPS